MNQINNNPPRKTPTPTPPKKPETQKEKEQEAKKIGKQIQQTVQHLGGQQKATEAIVAAQAKGAPQGQPKTDADKLLGKVHQLHDLAHPNIDGGHNAKNLTAEEISSTLSHAVNGLSLKQIADLSKQAQAAKQALEKQQQAGEVTNGWDGSSAQTQLQSQGPTQDYEADASGPVKKMDLQGTPTGGGSIGDMGPQLASQKKLILAELKKLGIKPPELEMILSIAMLETAHMLNSEHDGGKSGDSANFGLFNMNAKLLEDFCGVPQGAAQEALNKEGNIAGNVKAIVAGIKEAGADKFVNMLRSGQPGGNGEPTKNYKDALVTTMQAMQNDPKMLTDSRRLGIDVEHI